VRVEFDPNSISYSELLVVFWDRIDPTTLNRQGNDLGSQYRSGIYFHNEDQRKFALSSKESEQLKYSNPIVTEILPAKEWFRAEEYHQRYLEKGGQCARQGDVSPIRCYG
jgi:peptide-methionine (S)-S-oxide reductase